MLSLMITCTAALQPSTQNWWDINHKGTYEQIFQVVGGEREHHNMTWTIIDLNETHYFHPVITGAVSYTNKLFQWTIDVLAQGMIDTELLISHAGGLDKVNTFLEMTRDRKGMKKVILMDEV